MDGGYFDNSGAAAAQELLEIVRSVACLQYEPRFGFLMHQRAPLYGQEALTACKKRFHLLHISNDSESGSTAVIDTSRPDEQEKPKRGLVEAVSPIGVTLRTRSARGSLSVSSARTEVERGNFWEFRLCDRIPLGWQLSATAMEAMNSHLDEDSSCEVLDTKNNRRIVSEIASL